VNIYDQGKRDYEADVAARPSYHDGSPRKRWNALGTVERWSWARGAAQWDGNPKGEDPEGLRAKHDSPVPEGDAP
jgi:hypothetical protein